MNFNVFVERNLQNIREKFQITSGKLQNNIINYAK